MPIDEYKCGECRVIYNKEPKNGVCNACGGLVNKISRFDIKVKTSELVKGMGFRSQLEKNSYPNTVYP